MGNELRGRMQRWRRFAVVTALLAAWLAPTAVEAQSEEALVSQFVAAFNAGDIERIMGFFSDQAVYHNIPTQPVQGREAIRRAIESYLTPATEVDWEILRMATTGHAVLTERIDRFVINGRRIELPVMGVFEIVDGKIVSWRDYFDMATWQRQSR